MTNVPDVVPVTQADREAAAAWLRRAGYIIRAAETEQGVGFSDEGQITQAFARHRIAAEAAAIAPGFVLVPVEPTEAMVDAACRLYPDQSTAALSRFSHAMRLDWAAMVAAAPELTL